MTEGAGAHTEARRALQGAGRTYERDIPILQQTVGGVWKKEDELKQLKSEVRRWSGRFSWNEP